MRMKKQICLEELKDLKANVTSLRDECKRDGEVVTMQILTQALRDIDSVLVLEEYLMES